MTELQVENLEELDSSDVARSNDMQQFTMLGTPLLLEGRSTKLLGLSPQLWVHAKVHASGGGERGLHAHPHEDHAFFVLQGAANFMDQDGLVTSVGPFEGICIPRGVRYSFEVIGDENLVILRVGAGDSGGHRSGKLEAKMAQSFGSKPVPRIGIIAPGQTFSPSQAG